MKCTNIVQGGIACVNITVLEGNYVEVILPLQIKKGDEEAEDMDFSQFVNILMDIVDCYDPEKVRYTKALGVAIQITEDNKLMILFGAETLKYPQNKYKYDIFFIDQEGNGRTYVEGTITIKRTITKRDNV
jgi:hypothetical protein